MPNGVLTGFLPFSPMVVNRNTGLCEETFQIRLSPGSEHQFYTGFANLLILNTIISAIRGQPFYIILASLKVC